MTIYQIISLYVLITYTMILTFKMYNIHSSRNSSDPFSRTGPVAIYRWDTLLYAGIVTNFVVSVIGLKL